MRDVKRVEQGMFDRGFDGFEVLNFIWMDDDTSFERQGGFIDLSYMEMVYAKDGWEVFQAGVDDGDVGGGIDSIHEYIDGFLQHWDGLAQDIGSDDHGEDGIHPVPIIKQNSGSTQEYDDGAYGISDIV